MAHYFFSDPPNILLCVGIGTGYKNFSQIKVFCTAYASSLIYNKILYPS